MNIPIPPSIEYKGDGITKRFTFPFDYLRKAFIKVQLNDDAYNDFDIDGKVITFKDAPAKDAYIKIYRDTSTNRLVSWADASVLRAKDMTIQQIQELHILEEEDFRFQGIEDKVDDAVDDVIAFVTTAENAAISAELSATSANRAAQKAYDDLYRSNPKG